MGREQTSAMTHLINYLGKLSLPTLPTDSYLNSLGSRHGFLICLSFESFEGFQLMNTKDNAVA